MAEKLTMQQQMAVDSRGGKLLVSAAAGSGKTKVLIDRVMKYILDPTDPANIDEFLLITFTEAAASELKSKIAARLSEHISLDPTNRHLQRQMQRLYLTKISTVHSFCSDTLRSYAYRLDIPGDFRVGDENECRQLRMSAMDTTLESIYSRIHEFSDFQVFVDSQGAGRNDAQVVEVIQSVYNSSVCHIDPDRWLQSCIDNAAASNVTDLSKTVWGNCLMNDLFSSLDMHIPAMVRCAQALDSLEGQEKASATMWDNVNMLKQLRAAQTWDDIIKQKSLDFGTLRFNNKTADPSVVEPVKAVRDACKKTLLKNKLVRFTGFSSELLTELNDCAAAVRGLIDTVRIYNENYRRLKRARRILDYNDLEQYMLQLLLGKSRDTATSAARDIAACFREIMVDEYQDTNAVQDAIFEVLTEVRNNLFMVGDVKQSIYEFRLADPGIFLKKYATFVPAETAGYGQGRKVLLSANFRSGAGVIEAVNHVFSCCMSPNVGGLAYGESESLREGVPHIPLNDTEVELHCIIPAESAYDEEAAFVADRITELLDGNHFVRENDTLRPVILDDIVILLRSPGSTGSCYQYALESRGIPCSCSGSTNLLMTREVEVLHSLLKLISNPRQDIPLLSVLASPVGGFTADDLAQIRCSKKDVAFYDAMLCSDNEKCRAFLNILDTLRNAAMIASLPELLEMIFRLTRIDTIYAATAEGAACRENLLSFYHYAVRYNTTAGRDLDNFLYHLEVLGEKGISIENDSTSGYVRIMSIHKSKGLEFPVVFVCGLSKGFNNQDLLAPVLCHKELGLGMSCVDMNNRVRYPAVSKHALVVKKQSDSLSEELRILYVAMTRARDRLIMTYTDKSLAKKLNAYALRSQYSSDTLLASEVKEVGEWILLSALKRTEAGALFAVSDHPGNTIASKTPWRITLQQSVLGDDELPLDTSSAQEKVSIPLDAIRSALDFRYSHIAATTAPSKQTATERKGRAIDQEVSKEAPEPKQIYRYWRDVDSRDISSDGKKYGIAVHNVLRFIRYVECGTPSSVRAEIARLLEEEYISGEDAAMVSADSIAAFFATDVGRKLMKSNHVLREFKFSLLDDGNAYGDGLEGEKILLQGVVDCAIIESDGITVIDFKTDHVSPEGVETLAQHYTHQVDTYAYALERVFELPVKKKTLYFFRLNQFIWL